MLSTLLQNPPIPYFPFTGEAYQPKLGIQPLELSHWIEPGDDRSYQLTEKQRLVAQYPKQVIAMHEGALDACLELEQTLRQYLLEHWPQLYKQQGSCFHILPHGLEFNTQDIKAPLENIAQYVQEDFCLLSAKAPVLLEAGCLCFPSRWSLLDKMGKDTFGIHKPVPGFASTIGKPTQTFLERIREEGPVWRLNWTIHDSDELFCPKADEHPLELTVETVLARTFLRMERQTLRRLPQTKYVVFSIRTYVVPMPQVIANSERKQILTATLEQLPLDVAHYKGMRFFYPTLLAALRN